VAIILTVHKMLFDWLEKNRRYCRKAFNFEMPEPAGMKTTVSTTTDF
jgi:hypothetical protein